MRVAIARLRVWLGLGGWHVLHDDLRWLRRSIAPVRDLDVQLAQEPPPEWAAELRGRRAEAQRELMATLESERLPSLLEALRSMPPVPRDEARKTLATVASRALRRAKPATRRGAGLTPLHRLRCEVRRLRFALEWLGEDASGLATLQDALGDACDRSVTLRELGRRDRRSKTGKRRLQRFRRGLERDHDRAVRRARAAWYEVRSTVVNLCSSF